ncbi:DUF3577 domain-containing protein, partial [Neisseria gonorrhoeae]
MGLIYPLFFWRYIMTQSNQNYFNLTADGIGFLNRPREVQ